MYRSLGFDERRLSYRLRYTFSSKLTVVLTYKLLRECLVPAICYVMTDKVTL